MANKERGEATFTSYSTNEKGEEQKKDYKIVLTLHAWALAQDALTKGDAVPSIEEMTKRLLKDHLLTGIAVCYGALQRHHPEINSLEKTTELMSTTKGTAGAAILDALMAAYPDKKDVAELAKETAARPPEAQADGKKKRERTSDAAPDGTGVATTSTHAKSA